METTYYNNYYYTHYYDMVCFIGLTFNGNYEENKQLLIKNIETIKKLYNNELLKINNDYNNSINKLNLEERIKLNQIFNHYHNLFKKEFNIDTNINYMIDIKENEEQFKLLKNIEFQTTKRNRMWLKFAFHKKINEIIHTYNISKK